MSITYKELTDMIEVLPDTEQSLLDYLSANVSIVDHYSLTRTIHYFQPGKLVDLTFTDIGEIQKIHTHLDGHYVQFD